jgi:hypothetical protein
LIVGGSDAVNQITQSIFLGPFASPARLGMLRSAGITHVLNVGEAPSVLVAGPESMREVIWHAIEDLERIPTSAGIESLESLHRMVCQSNARVYVHCVAGWNRSPTIVWLYLIACGRSREEAKATIEKRARDAVPGHVKLADATLVEEVQRHGRAHFLPHPRPDALVPFG